MSLNNEVRYRILERLYDYEQDRPGTLGVNRKNMLEYLGYSTSNIVDRNVLYLEEKGLVELLKSLGSLWEMASITAHGIDVIENKQKYSNEYPFVVQEIHIHGDVHGSVVQANNSTVTITQTQSKNMFQKAREMVQESDLDDSKKREAIENIDTIEEECNSDTPKVGRIKSAVEWMKRNAKFAAPIITTVATKVVLTEMGLGG